MTWECFAFNSQTFLAFTDRKMKLQNYQDILVTNLVPIIDLLARPDYVFQQDGASSTSPIHPKPGLCERI